MLSSPSRTPIQGHNDLCSSSERVPRSTGGDLKILVESHSSAAPAAAAPEEPRSICPEPYSTLEQQQSAILGHHSTSDGVNDESLVSPTSNYIPVSLPLRAQGRMTHLTGDKLSTDSPEPSSPRPGSWYTRRNKNNAPQHVEIPSSTTGDTASTRYRTSSSMTAITSKSASGDARIKAVTSPSTSRFSFFSMAGFKGPTTTSPVLVPRDDELINLDIDAALFSTGTVQHGESVPPAAFKNFHMNAAGLLRKFQSAYQDKAIACQELRAERDSQQDEKLELETRAAYLKMQLDEMARKASETEFIMQALLQELNQEKKLRLQEKASRESVVLSSGTSTMSEDLGAEDDQRRKHHRHSAGTMKSDDAGFDTDEESIDQLSLFSRPRSPTLAAGNPLDGSSTYSGTILSNVHVPQVTKLSVLEPPRSAKQAQPQQVSTFQKLMKGISGDSTKRESTYGCQNCQGQDASVAWDTASLLQNENKGLKERVSDLEAVIEGALDAVMGVKL
ncbi:hypothetical protein E4U43_002102 [Claviceps pusilla]|uniref:Uncharacterized protein n=1 Tax=Claviceps pusilla TaxID=123648 RepID=A0A9P7N8S9_9HYPO|nr:hypothetical protein E4U43_002102 [Claviceps pusilla]